MKNLNQLKAGAVLSYVVLGLNSLLGLIYIPYMLRKMGQSEYGLYSLVASVIAYLTMFDLGFGNAIIRYTAKFRKENNKDSQYEMFGMFFILYSIIGLIVFILGLFLYFNINWIFGDSLTNTELDRSRVLFLLMIINLAITFPLSIFGAIISGYENYVFQKIVNIVRVILNTILMVILLELGYKSIGMVVVISVLNIATLIVNYIHCKFKLKIKLYFRKIKWEFLKEVSMYSFFIFLNIIMDKVYWNTGQFVLGAFVGTSAVAVFAVAIQLQQMYMGFSSAISGVFLPKVTGMVVDKNSGKEISQLFLKTGRIQFIVVFTILLFFILIGRQFVQLWAGKGYEDVYSIALILFIPLTIPLIQNLGIIILQARNQMKFRSILYIFLAILSLLIQIPLAKKYGGIGCALGIAIALILGQFIGMNIYYHRKQNIDILSFWKNISRMAIAPLLTFSMLYYFISNIEILSYYKLALVIVISMIIYLPILWFFSMNNYERNLLLMPLEKMTKKIKNQ